MRRFRRQVIWFIEGDHPFSAFIAEGIVTSVFLCRCLPLALLNAQNIV